MVSCWDLAPAFGAQDVEPAASKIRRGRLAGPPDLPRRRQGRRAIRGHAPPRGATHGEVEAPRTQRPRTSADAALRGRTCVGRSWRPGPEGGPILGAWALARRDLTDRASGSTSAASGYPPTSPAARGSARRPASGSASSARAQWGGIAAAMERVW